jgi:hypothetical protein
MKPKKLLRKFSVLLIVLFVAVTSVKAQYLLNSDSAFKAGAANSGRLWGYEFSDYYFKGHSDSLNRGGSNQYTGIPQNRSGFQSRRIYLGYDYNITTKFSAELLLAAEDDGPTATSNLTSSTVPGTSGLTSGNNDALQNNKLSFYIKLANVRVKSIWKGADLVIGQVATPSFPLLSEKIWNYRSIERTISDIRRTPSYDMGATIQGVFDPATKNFGYDVMVGNGSSAKPEADNFKWFYGDVYGYFLHKKLVVDAYADYERMNWTSAWHHSRQMLKGFVAYNSAATDKGMDPGNGFTIGVEGFINNLKQDLLVTKVGGFASTVAADSTTIDNEASGISMYIHGDIVKHKLRFFARYDVYNPSTKINNAAYSKYTPETSNYNDGALNATTTNPAATSDKTYKQDFLTAGLDFTPVKNVHFMPNIWYEHYASQLDNVKTSQAGDYDLVYRMTFYYIFGK